MRQADIAPKGTWTANRQVGVKAPQALILPDLSTRFASTADRLEELTAHHPLAQWLLLLSRVARAQHVTALKLAPFAELEQSFVDRAVAARMPPLAIDGHRRDPVWREGLFMLMDSLSNVDMPAEAATAMTDLRQREADALEKFADKFLSGALAGSDGGAALFFAASLQVYFTSLATSLHAPSLRLLEQRGLCPCCGSTPVSGVVTASGETPGMRYLCCSLCSTAWNHVRAVCITCGGSRSLSLKGIDGDPGVVKAEACGECHTYSKVLYQARDVSVDPFADDLASLGLDILVSEAGFARHAPNPLLLVAQD